MFLPASFQQPGPPCLAYFRAAVARFCSIACQALVVGLLFLAIVCLPIAELFVLIRIGRVVGAWYTLLGVVVIGLLGAYLAKLQGLRVIKQWQEALQQGRLPEEGIVGGSLVLLGCVLLITPGIISDFIGLALLLPFTRRALLPFIKRAIERRIQNGTIRVQTIGNVGFGRHSPDGVIDTQGEDVTSQSRVGPGRDA
jgi:UPF0716 protein FxsA